MSTPHTEAVQLRRALDHIDFGPLQQETCLALTRVSFWNPPNFDSFLRLNLPKSPENFEL